MINIGLRVAIHKAQQTELPPRFRFAWDDELSDYGYKCRTQAEGFVGPDNPPAVLRFARQVMPAGQDIGDYRVNLTKDPAWGWQQTIIELNDGDVKDFDYLVGPSRAQFNTTGWAQMAYVGMSGNEIHVLERVGGWVKFETLKPTDWYRARSMSRETMPHLIHSFTCVTWDAATQTTKHIESTGTPRGQVFYPLVTWEGFGWIPERFVVER